MPGGLSYALAKGVATITATLNDVKQTATLTVQ